MDRTASSSQSVSPVNNESKPNNCVNSGLCFGKLHRKYRLRDYLKEDSLAHTICSELAYSPQRALYAKSSASCELALLTAKYEEQLRTLTQRQDEAFDLESFYQSRIAQLEQEVTQLKARRTHKHFLSFGSPNGGPEEHAQLACELSLLLSKIE